MAQYNCLNCPGYCCSYPVIALNMRDVERLAKHFKLPVKTAQKKFTRAAHGHKYVMRRKGDKHFGRICQFFDTKKRQCTVYTARPVRMPRLSGRRPLRVLRFPDARTPLPERRHVRRDHQSQGLSGCARSLAR